MIITHPLYIAPIPLYVHLYAHKEVFIDGDSSFVKQTFRNRATIATENGTQTLTIPVIHDGRQPMRDVRISEHGNWRHLHWNALASAYRKSPFFDYYADDFAHFYEERNGFLMDFNLRLHHMVCELMNLEHTCTILDESAMERVKNNITDLRCLAEPKCIADDPQPHTAPYYQVFALRNGFIKNLSIVDLLFNMGPEALLVLRDTCNNAKTALL